MCVYICVRQILCNTKKNTDYITEDPIIIIIIIITITITILNYYQFFHKIPVLEHAIIA